MQLDRFNVDAGTSCKKGCSHCCYIDVEITKDEAELLAKVCDDNDFTPDMDMLRALSKGKANVPYEDRACIFLDKEKGECKVYGNRPLACRKYFVVNDPDRCNSEKYPAGKTEVLIHYGMEFFVSGIYTAMNPGQMEKMLLEYFERRKNKGGNK